MLSIRRATTWATRTRPSHVWQLTIETGVWVMYFLYHCQQSTTLSPQPHNRSPRFPPNHQTKLMIPLRNGDEGVLGTVALRKLETFVGVVSGFTAHATDPLRALEPLVPCFLVNAAEYLTVFFSRCGSTSCRVITATTELCSLPIVMVFVPACPLFFRFKPGAMR